LYSFGTGRAEERFPVFRFDGTTPVRTVDELLQNCAKTPQAAARHLAAGEIERWLKLVGRSDLAHVAEESRRAGADPGEALYLFIEFSRMRNYLRRTPRRRLSVLTVGRTGVGKSSMINTLAGRKIADTGETVPVTASVHSYELQINGVPSRIVDTPGLCDGKNLDDSYMDWIRSDVGRLGIDCVLFFTPLYETRVRTDEITAIEKISTAFGVSLWRRSLVVLTFSDYLRDTARYAAKVEGRPEPIRRAIAAAISDPLTVAAIPFIPVTNEQDLNPDGRKWLGMLQLALLDRMAPEGTSLFYGTGPGGGRDDTRFRCYWNDTDPAAYRFICRSSGMTGNCNFCGLPFKKWRA
jgi:hypothetical protein